MNESLKKIDQKKKQNPLQNQKMMKEMKRKSFLWKKFVIFIEFLAVQFFWMTYSKRQKQLPQYIGFRWPTKRLNSEMKLVKRENDFGKNVEKQGK